MTKHPPFIELLQVRKEFKGTTGPVHAVAGIDLTITKGEIVAFLGPNGAGKTTTIDMILGLTQPTSGKILIDGQTPRQAIVAGRVSAVLQTGGLLRDLTVRETLQAVGALHGKADRINTVAQQTNLTELLGRRVSKCSGGEQQRVKFALALLNDPDLLILDEPTAGMDVNARRDFWNTMQNDAKQGRTIIFATHYLEEAEAYAQRTVLVAHGKIIADGPTDHIRAVASGRIVSATIDADKLDQVLADIRALPATQSVSANGARISVSSRDSDALAQKLLVEFAARDLEISAPSLENAFVNLTNAADAPSAADTPSAASAESLAGTATLEDAAALEDTANTESTAAQQAEDKS